MSASEEIFVISYMNHTSNLHMTLLLQM